MVHSKKLEETALWKAYQDQITSGSTRAIWVKEVHEAAATYMLDVRKTFQNYTLHDETHIINVLDAMGGLLGDQISKLTVGEMELLILAASLHDLGMVYTEIEKKRHYDDTEACRKFLKEYCPEFLDCPVEEWGEDLRQWYLRTLHPFRIPEVLQNQEWKELFSRCPLEVVPKRCILAVCEAHGKNPMEISRNRDLDYLEANDADPLFCALLLRLGDLLDFDDTRAPKVLYSYVVCNEKSRGEWDKHRASAGFRYPESPSGDDLPYKACCTNPGVEHAIRDFLDWVDDELGNCMKLQKYCRASWQQKFPFPRAVLRSEIESDGYMSGDFCLTMDQTKVLELLTGENLYNNMDVFVRELLQNAIDATLLRGEMDRDFIPEKSRIDLWEWNDKEGNIWFRIDDQGTGMTLGMLQRYFLKVGNSYYTSREMERDLREHGQSGKYHGIGRFGIGFLSCFLCGDYAEVSTLYFDSDKNRREESAVESYQTIHYGLRLQVTGLSGYYTLKNQAKHHLTDEQMPKPANYDTEMPHQSERDGYRSQAGTTIAIRLNPGKLGALNLRDAVEKYLCGARVPVYYNGKRIGRTYGEVMQAAHDLAGETIYELTDKMKEQYDQTFPAVRGLYPKIAMTVVPLDTEEDRVLPDVSGILIKYEVRFDKMPEWQVKDLKYGIQGYVGENDDTLQLILQSECLEHATEYIIEWERLVEKFDEAEVEALAVEFENLSICPQTEEQLGEVWHPFAEYMSLYGGWRAYHIYQQSRRMHITFEDYGCPSMTTLTSNRQCEKLACVYQGVVAGRTTNTYSSNYSNMGIFFLENKWRPIMEVSRFNVKELPLEINTVISGIVSKYQMLGILEDQYTFNYTERTHSLKEWREVRTQLGQWMENNEKKFGAERMKFIKAPWGSKEADKYSLFKADYSDYAFLNMYYDAYLQDYYEIEIDYEKQQVISFNNRDEIGAESVLDIFPPMMFCKAANDASRRYICCANPFQRKGITLDHPFVAWLLDNAILLNQYYQRQFCQMVDGLRHSSAESIVREFNQIRQQLMSLPEHHGVDVNNFPQLSMDDFWSVDDSKIN